MNSIARVTLLSVCLFFVARVGHAQEEMQLSSRIGATLQAWASYQKADVDNVGFGLRRVRVRWYGSVSSKLRTFVQVDLTSNSLAGTLVDARIEYHFSEQFNIRAGRFVGAGVRGGSLTSHSIIDIIERPTSANKWASNTVGADFRDFGFQAEARSASGEFTGRLFIHNGNGATNVLNRESTLATAEYSPSAIDAMVFYKPNAVNGLEVGGHYGIGNKDEKDLSSFSAYAYYEPGPFRVKAELVSVTNETGVDDITSLGYYLFGGYQVTDHVEVVGRYEPYDPNMDVDDDGTAYITLGAVYKQFAGRSNHKFTAAVVLPSEQGTRVDNTTVYAMWQILF